jgi:hypothetical protein
MKDLIVAAGLSVTEVAELADVSRSYLYDRFEGTTVPHPIICEHIDSLFEKIKGALNAGKLPLPSSIRRKERMAVLKKVLADF